MAWLCSALPAALAAPAVQPPPWTYDSLQQLVAAGYLAPPEKPLSECSRQELSQLAAKALHAIDQSEPHLLPENYSQANRRAVMPETQPTSQETDSAALKKYTSAAKKAKALTEIFIRSSMQGQNRLEIMTSLKEKSDLALDQLESAARDYALEKSRANPASDPEAKDSLSTEYGRLARRIVIDEVQLKLSREQENRARKICDDAARHAKSEAGTNVKSSKPEPKKQDSPGSPAKQPEQAQQQVDFAAHDYALAQNRNYQRATRLAYEEARQKNLLDAISGHELQEPAMASNTPSDHAARLRAEFLSELEDSGYLDEADARQQLSSNIPVRDNLGPRFKVDGELRLDYGHSSGEVGFGDRTRLRARIYPDFNIDGNWHLKAMAEWEKVLSGPKGSKDGKFRLDRYYLTGDLGVIHADIGAFGSLMAEGNIYDSRFRGIRLSAGKPVRYTVEYGKVNGDDIKRNYDVTASYDTADYGVDGGYYHFDRKDGSHQDIYMANYRHRLGIFDVGAMLLYGRRNGDSGTGYILSLAYTPEDSWRPKASSYWIKYYHQPAATYVAHTMSGMADAMIPAGGFRGFGIGYTYNLARDWVWGLEFYHLWDLYRGRVSDTFWTHVTRYFNSYVEQ